MGEGVASLVAIEGGGESSDENALPNTPFMPVGFSRENADVFFLEVVLRISSMLHDG